jgi:hypothetical protein
MQTDSRPRAEGGKGKGERIAPGVWFADRNEDGVDRAGFLDVVDDMLAAVDQSILDSTDVTDKTIRINLQYHSS